MYDRFPSFSRGEKKKKKRVLSITSIHLYPLNSSFFHKVKKRKKKKKFLFKPAIETRSSFVTDVSTSSSNFSPFHPHLQFETINKRSYEFKFFNVVDAFSSSPPFLFILSSLSFSLLSSFPSFFLRTFEQIILNSATEDDFRRLERNRGDARFFARKFEDAGREVDEQEARDIAGEIACNKNNCRPMFYASRWFRIQLWVESSRVY